MTRFLTLLCVFVAIGVLPAVAQDTFQYFYISGECDEGSQFWNMTVVNSNGIPVRNFGLDCHGDVCASETDGKITDGKLTSRKIVVDPSALKAELWQNSIRLTPQSGAKAWFVNAQTQKIYSMNQLNADEATTVNTSEWPRGIYVVFAERDGALVGFKRFEHF